MHKNLKYPCDRECATAAPMTASPASLLQLARGRSNPLILNSNWKHVIRNLERTTITLSFYSAFTADNAPVGRLAAMLLIHTSAPQDWKCSCHTE